MTSILQLLFLTIAARAPLEAGAVAACPRDGSCETDSMEDLFSTFQKPVESEVPDNVPFGSGLHLVKLHRDEHEPIALPELDMNRSYSKPNFCMDGRIVPELYLIGAQKASTSTFANFFQRSPSVCKRTKEVQYLTSEMKFTKRGGKEGWLNQFPKCRDDARMVCYDGTPLLRFDYPVTKLRDLYADLADRIQFAVILRNPVDRMFSAYWHSKFLFEGLGGLIRKDPKSRPPRDWGKEESERTFQEIADRLNAGKGTGYSGGLLDIYDGSLYERQLRRWFSHFAPSQFFMMLFKDVTSDEALSSESLVQHALWKKLDLQIPGPFEQKNIYHYQHPSLEESISTASLVKLRTLFDAEASPGGIAQILYGSGAELWSCDPCSTKEHVRSWVESGW